MLELGLEKMENPPNIKLLYFDKRANAEAIRFLLKYGNLNFLDIRISKESWLEIKDRTLFGRLPILKVNEEEIDETIAICRYVANLINLMGMTPLENLRIDSIVEHINDLRYYVSDYNTELACTSKKQQLRLKLKNELFPFYFKKFNAIVAAGYIACGRLTWADFYFVAFLDYAIDVMEEEVTEKYPHLEQLRGNIHSLPGIKEWIASRPYSLY